MSGNHLVEDNSSSHDTTWLLIVTICATNLNYIWVSGDSKGKILPQLFVFFF